MLNIAVIGAGAWGTALANTFAENHNPVWVWDRNHSIIEEINRDHRNQGRLGDVILRKTLKATTSVEDILPAQILILATPAQTMRQVCCELKGKVNKDTILVIAAKGIERKTGYLMSHVVEEVLPENPVAVLSGPNFAAELVLGFPAASTIFAPLSYQKVLQDALSSKNFRLYTSCDLIGGQLGGSLKNVMAIASGIVEGLNFGENARAALVTRGLHEITVLGRAMGAETETFYGLAGMGDLILTAMGTLSRNFKFGNQLAKGVPLAELVNEFNTVEGYETAASIKQLMNQYNINMPIAEAVYNILYEGADLYQSVQTLLSRPLTQEARD